MQSCSQDGKVFDGRSTWASRIPVCLCVSIYVSLLPADCDLDSENLVLTCISKYVPCPATRDPVPPPPSPSGIVETGDSRQIPTTIDMHARHLCEYQTAVKTTSCVACRGEEVYCATTSKYDDRHSAATAVCMSHDTGRRTMAPRKAGTAAHCKCNGCRQCQACLVSVNLLPCSGGVQAQDSGLREGSTVVNTVSSSFCLHSQPPACLIVPSFAIDECHDVFVCLSGCVQPRKRVFGDERVRFAFLHLN